MIDKKIEEAKEEIYEDRFLLNGEEVVFDNDAKEELFYEEDIKEAIGLGAKWAINELLKDLWHPNTEEPDKSKSDIITLGFDNDAYLQFKESILWKEESWRHSSIQKLGRELQNIEGLKNRRTRFGTEYLVVSRDQASE